MEGISIRTDNRSNPRALTHRLFDYLSEAWVLINTAAREGLPLTFIEAAAHRCAILSECNPDGYASNFGYHVTAGNIVRGLEWLLADEKWWIAGERANMHVTHEHNSGTAIKRQLSIYDAALARSTGRSDTPRLNSAPVVE